MKRLTSSTSTEGRVKIIRRMLLEGHGYENEIRRSYKLNKDRNEARENFAYCAKLYKKLMEWWNKLKLERTGLKMKFADEEKGKMKGYFTCHNLEEYQTEEEANFEPVDEERMNATILPRISEVEFKDIVLISNDNGAEILEKSIKQGNDDI
jgi:hypothetical protein